MDDRLETLRSQIELYRRCLQQSIDADLARIFLLKLSEAEFELTELMRRGVKKRHRLARSIVE